MGTRQALPVSVRMRLFRQCRLVSAAVVLAAFPLMAALSLEPLAVIASLVLFAVLPAAIAMDTGRAAYLDRSLVLALLCAAVVLFAGSLRGLSGPAAIALLAIAIMEALLLARPVARARIALIGGAGMAAILSAALTTEPAFGVGSSSLATAMAMLVANTSVLVTGMMRTMNANRSLQSNLLLQSSNVETVMRETILTVDATGNVRHLSNNSDRLLGIPAEALLGRGLLNLVLVSERPAVMAALSSVFTGPDKNSIRFHMRRSVEEGVPQYRWVELTAFPAADPSAHSLATLQDISAEVAEEERLKKAEKEYEMAKTARSAFLATINHELRTPLNAIIGFSDILANPTAIPHTSAKAQEYAGLINTAGRDLHRMVSAMVDMTRMDSGLYEIDKESVDIRGLVEAGIDAFQHEPEGKDVAVSLIMHEKTLDIEIDSRAIRNALQQLLSNAAKFGRNKPVSIRVSADRREVTVSVTDQGPGIPKDRLAHLGKPFSRFDEGLSRQHNGIGLGLSLVNGIVELHQGRLGIESEPDKGTTVTMMLPRISAVQPTNLVQLSDAKAESPAESSSPVSLTTERGRRRA